MADRGTGGFHRPFAGLAKALRHSPVRRSPPPTSPPPAPDNAGETPAPADHPMTPAEERRLFLEAMAGVVPIACRHRSTAPSSPRRRRNGSVSADAMAVDALCKLVCEGRGFVVDQTAEYVEGRQRWIPAEVTRRLHRGHFSVQAFIDLHGLSAAAAAEAVDAFLVESLRLGRRVVLIVHGRGLCSPGRPVLKQHLCQWLTRGKWRKWTLAFTSAPRHDGGAGGTYVLLGRRQIPKKRRRLDLIQGG